MACTNFEKIDEEVDIVKPHVILMDISIPIFDGFYWCKKIRKKNCIPIIIVSSRDSNMDIIMAISNGADDYVVKPFDTNVLIAKINAVIRRTYQYKCQENMIIKHNNLVLRLDDATLLTGDKIIELTKNEFEILKILITNSGSIVKRNEIMKRLWNDDIYVNENTLTVNINRLRKKLLDEGIEDCIETKKGIGYIIK
ncbi:response regulator transcription factor [Clostridium gasigenes]|uniref:response regulator transcription factor n=1 Tax=Clostridium gasigenes TaxID=94869 RepID=UPI001FD0FD90|nr:response regulator transcription factor [Clostridium gasigenes]